MVSLPTKADQRPVPHPRRILDAHHHFWDRGNGHYPWLSEAHDFFLGDYALLRQGNRMPADYVAAARPYQIVGTVHIEAERERSERHVRNECAASSPAQTACARSWPEVLEGQSATATRSTAPPSSSRRESPIYACAACSGFRTSSCWFMMPLFLSCLAHTIRA